MFGSALWSSDDSLYTFSLWHQQQIYYVLVNLLSWQVVHLQTLVLWVQLQMRDVLGCRTVLYSLVVLCATVVSSLDPLLSTSVTLLTIWRALV